MVRLILKVLVLSAPGVLLLPGNEAHRDQVITSLTAAYAQAGNYCTKNQMLCDQAFDQARNAGAAVMREAIALADTAANNRRREMAPPADQTMTTEGWNSGRTGNGSRPDHSSGRSW